LSGSGERIGDVLARTEGLAEGDLLARFPCPVLVQEATDADPTALEPRTVPIRKRAAARPVGDDFARSDVWVYPLRPTGDEVDGATVRLGRDDGLEVVVADGSISAHHATFTLERARDAVRARVADAGSSNGTWVDGRRLAAGAPVALDDSTSIRFGPALKFQYFTPSGFCAFLSYYRRIPRAGLGRS